MSWQSATIALPCAWQRSPRSAKSATFDAIDDAGDFEPALSHCITVPTCEYMFVRAPRP